MFTILPHLPIKIIFGNLNFNDVINLTKVPLIRSVVLDYYEREMNKSELLKKSFDELIVLICDDRDHIITYFETEFTEIGMKSYYETETYYKIQKECLYQFLPDEINSINIRNMNFQSVDQKRDYLMKNLCIENIYDIVNQLAVTSQRKEILYTIFLDKRENQIDSHSKHKKEFVVNYITGKDGFRKTLKLVEIFMDNIYKYYSNIFSNQDLKFGKSYIPLSLKQFYKLTLQRLNSIEMIFYK